MQAIAELTREVVSGSSAALVRVQDLPAAATVDETAQLLRTSRSTVYGLFETGELKSFSLGRKRLVSGASIAQLMRDREQESYTPTCEVAGSKSAPGRGA